MIKRYFFIFAATLFILFTPTTGVKATFLDPKLKELSRRTNSPPSEFNYQAVLRDNNGNVLANTSVTVRFTLSDANGDVWIETHAATTNAYGVVSLVIGDGTNAGGTAASFDAIDWSVDLFIQVEADSGNGFVDLGTSELQSVPYANYARNGVTGDQQNKLDGIQANAEQNVQSDWNNTDNTSDAFIRNKPTVPTDINQLTDNSGLLGGSGFDGSFNSLTDVPANLDTDATDDFSGSFNDLTDVPADLADGDDDTVYGAGSGLNLASGIFSVDNAAITPDYGNLTNVPPDLATTADLVFTNNANVSSGGDADDDLVFGSSQLADSGDPDEDRRITFDKSKGAFRAGAATDTQWDAPGYFSFATGFNNTASANYSVVGGGYNTATGNFGIVVGGRNNLTSGDHSFIGGGRYHTASGSGSSVVGGFQNTASGQYSTVLNGNDNDATAPRSTITGGMYNSASGRYSTVIGGRDLQAQARSEVVIGQYSSDATSPDPIQFISTDRLFTIGNGSTDAARSNAMVVLKNGNTDINGSLVANSLGVDGVFTLPTGAGTSGQVLTTGGDGTTSWTTQSGPFTNTANVIFGGDSNDDFVFGSTQLANVAGTSDDNRVFFDKSSGAFRAGRAQSTQWDIPGIASFAAGINNTATGNYSTIGGGHSNMATGQTSVIAGGHGNQAGNFTAFVGGGYMNTASASYSVVGGGYTNTASGQQSTVSGGWGNSATANSATVGGGYQNSAGNNAFVGGGSSNDASGSSATVGGGSGNTASGQHATVAGGLNNDATAVFSSVGGGIANLASGTSATIGGGRSNTASLSYATVGGGYFNNATGSKTTIGGGQSNTASGTYSTVAGGYLNTASGHTSSVAGGQYVSAESFGEFAAGINSLDAVSTTATSFVATDRIFTLGNGSSAASRSNAMVVLKNGNTTINGQLTLSDGSNPITFPNADGSDGELLSTDGTGTVDWISLAPTILRSTAASITVPDETREYIISHDGSQAFTVTLPTSSNTGDKIIISLNDGSNSESLNFASTPGSLLGVAPNNWAATLSTNNPSIEMVYDGTTWVVISGTIVAFP